MTEVTCLKQELAEKQNELDMITRSFEEFMESSREVEKEFEGMLTDTEQKLNESKLKNRQLEEKLSTSQAALANVNKEINKLSSDYQAANKKYLESENRKTSIECENDMLKEKWRILESTEEQLRANLERVEEDLVFVQSDLDVLQMSSQENERRDAETIMELRQEIVLAQQRLLRAETKAGIGINGELVADDMEVEQEEEREEGGRIAELEAANVELQSHIDELRAAASQHTEQSCALSTPPVSSRASPRGSSVAGSPPAFHGEHDQEQIQQLQGECSRLIVAMDQLTQRYTVELTTVSRLHEQRQHEVDEFRGDLRAARDSIRQLNEEAHARDAEFAELQERYVDVEAELSRARELLESAAAASEELTGNQGPMLAALERTVEDMRIQLEESASECQLLREEAARVQYQGNVAGDRFLVELKSEREARRLDMEAAEARLEHVRGDHRAELDALALRLLEKDAAAANLERVCADWQCRCEAGEKGPSQHQTQQAQHERAGEQPGGTKSGWSLLSTWGGPSTSQHDAAGDANNIKWPNEELGTAEESVQLALLSNNSERVKTELLAQLTRFQTVRERNHRLLAKLQTTRADIQIMCRVRPLLEVEQFQNQEFCMDQVNGQEISCYVKRDKAWKSFYFDQVWCAEADEVVPGVRAGDEAPVATTARASQTQAEMFLEIEPNLCSLLEGVNVCICACGRSESGKSFTMSGHDGALGLTHRMLSRLFEVLQSRQREVRERAEAAERDRAQTWRSKGSPLGSPVPGGRASRGFGSVLESADRNGDSLPSRNSSLSLSASLGSTGPGADNEEGVFYYQVKLSMVEVYNETVRDLLNPIERDHNHGRSHGYSHSSESGLHPLQTLELIDDGQGGVSIPGMTQVLVSNFDDSVAVFGRGVTNRALSVADISQHASRSHCIFIADVTSSVGNLKALHKTNSSGFTGSGVPGEGAVAGKLTHARLYLVDTAGTEHIHTAANSAAGNIAPSGPGGRCSTKEAQCINRSLSALGEVVHGLVQARETHPTGNSGAQLPYKNSKLTMVLADCFRVSAPARVVVIATLSPAAAAVDDSLFTLQYATRLKAVVPHGALARPPPHSLKIDPLEQPLHGAGGSSSSSGGDKVKELEAEVRALRAENEQLARPTSTASSTAMVALSGESGVADLAAGHDRDRDLVAIRQNVESLHGKQRDVRELSSRYEREFSGLQVNLREMKERMARLERDREAAARVAQGRRAHGHAFGVAPVSAPGHGGTDPGGWGRSVYSSPSQNPGHARTDPGPEASSGTSLGKEHSAKKRPSVTFADNHQETVAGGDNEADEGGSGADFTGQVQFVQPVRPIVPVVVFAPAGSSNSDASDSSGNTRNGISNSGSGIVSKGGSRDNIAVVATGILNKSQSSVTPAVDTVVTRAIEDLAASGTVPPAPANAVNQVAAGPNYYSNISDYYAANATGATRAQPKDRPPPPDGGNGVSDGSEMDAHDGRRGISAMSPSQPQRNTPAKRTRAGPQYSTPGKTPSRLAGVTDVVSELYRSSVSRESKTPPRRNSPGADMRVDNGGPAKGSPVVTSDSIAVSSSGIPMRTPPRRGTYGYNVGGSGATVSSTASTVYLQSLSSRNTPLTPYTEARTHTPGSASRYTGEPSTSYSPPVNISNSNSPSTSRGGPSPAPQRMSVGGNTPSSASKRTSSSPGAVSRAAAAEMKHQERIRRSKSKAEDRHFDKNTF